MYTAASNPFVSLFEAALVCLGLFALVGCNSSAGEEEPQHARRPALTKLIEGDDFPFFHTSTFQYGSEGPAQPIGGMTAATWHKWATEAWPRACQNIETRLVTGRILDKRQCFSEAIVGIEAMEQMRSTGFLQIESKLIPVVWQWSRFQEKDRASCKFDPVPLESTKFRLTRSSNFRNWQLSVAKRNSYVLMDQIAEDGVWQNCGDLKRLLAR